MSNLWTPWRLAYLSADRDPVACVLCDALGSGDDDKALIVYRASRAFVILNRYPYSNGHLMIVPNDHVGSLAETEPDALTEMMALATVSEVFLQEELKPSGFNLGMNLGKSAGAGVVGHIHLHVVPRWDGDSNYMAVVNDIRIIPERLESTLERLRARFSQLG